MAGPGIVEQYWTGVATQLQVEADIFNRLVEHRGETGRANELALARLVSRLLPTEVDVSTGVLIDSAGRRSKQTDLIVYLKGSQPQILAQSTQLLFPVETVVAALEVKTTVDSAAIEDAAEKVERIRALRPVNGTQGPATGLFGFSAAGTPSARASELNALSPERRPDLACILTPGLVGASTTQGLAMSLVPLHETDESEARISRTWVRAPDEGAMVVRGGTSYPVSRLTPYATERYVFEPGRALLLFAEALLSAISSRTQIDGAWLSAYLPDIAREVEPPVPPTDAE